MDYGRKVQFGVLVTPDATQPQRAVDTAMLADELGFDVIGVQDHPYQRRFFDTWTAMRKFAAEVAPRVREQVESRRLSRAH